MSYYSRISISLICLGLLDLLMAPIIQADYFIDDIWSYSAQDKWPPMCSTGRRQSPIPIVTMDAQYDKSLITPLRFINFDINVNVTVMNPGDRGIRWIFDSSPSTPDAQRPKIAGGGLSGDYFIDYISSHWSPSDCEGSDHYVDYKASPLEIQVVTSRSVVTADNEPTSPTYAIFSYLFEYAREENSAINQLLAPASMVAQFGAFTMWNFTLNKVFPPLSNTPQFYRYNGSLTTPPCTESAVWTIFAAKQPISRQQMSVFRRVIVSAFGAPSTAFRSLQYPYQRRVVTNVRSPTASGLLTSPTSSSESCHCNTATNSQIISTTSSLPTIINSNNGGNDEPDWSYIDQDKWPGVCLTGHQQSPITVNTSQVVYDDSLTNLKFVNFQFAVNGTITNRGDRGIRWAADLEGNDVRLPKVVGGGLIGDYRIRYIDFRWAADDRQGSDHFIDGKASPLEMQLITFRSNADTPADVNDNNTIAIFSYLFEVDEDASPVLIAIFYGVDQVAEVGSRLPLSIVLKTIIPPLPATPQFYRYFGSLSTPPCTEAAIWTVFAAKQRISRQEISNFRNVQSSINPVSTAFRQLQEPYGRRVLTNVRPSNMDE